MLIVIEFMNFLFLFFHYLSALFLRKLSLSDSIPTFVRLIHYFERWGYGTFIFIFPDATSTNQLHFQAFTFSCWWNSSLLHIFFIVPKLFAFHFQVFVSNLQPSGFDFVLAWSKSQKSFPFCHHHIISYAIFFSTLQLSWRVLSYLLTLCPI